jgi:uroporphyrinogen decarboxylase
MPTRQDIVNQAITFADPPRIPIWFVNCDQTEGDVLMYHLSLGREGDGSGNSWDWATNEWGYRLEKLNDGTMGHPQEAYLPDWDTAQRLQPPALREAERMASLPAYLARCEDRYRLASLDLSGFTVYTLLRGFEHAMEDFLLEPDRFDRLMNLIFDVECDLMRLAARHGFHGIHFADDWATQRGMMISPDLWRQLFKPGYRRQFALAHQLGLHVWYHCCGDFGPIVEDFHEIGVDVLNISQPNVVDVQRVGARLQGRQCFLMPISYQTVSISGTVDEIYGEAERLHGLLGAPHGGFIGYVEEYSCMGMSARNYRACAEAFRRLRVEGRSGFPA